MRLIQEPSLAGIGDRDEIRRLVRRLQSHRNYNFEILPCELGIQAGNKCPSTSLQRISARQIGRPGFPKRDSRLPCPVIPCVHFLTPQADN
jgi:hypothetical protein